MTTCRAPNVPELNGFDPTPGNLTILNAMAAGNIRRRAVVATGAVRPRLVRIRDVDETTTTHRILDTRLFTTTRMAMCPSVGLHVRSASFYLTKLGEAVLQFYGPGAPPRLLPPPRTGQPRHIPAGRTIPDFPTERGLYDLVGYRAAVFLDTATMRLAGRDLRVACTEGPNFGVGRSCHLDASRGNRWATCVHCLISDARADYAVRHPHVAQSELCASMVTAWEVAEGEGLHLDVPDDRVVAADRMAAAVDVLHRESLPVPGHRYRPARFGLAPSASTGAPPAGSGVAVRADLVVAAA